MMDKATIIHRLGCQAPRQITTGGGEEPQWAPDAKSIVYENQGHILRIDELTPGEPTPPIHMLPTFGQPVQLTRDGHDSNPQWMRDR